MSGTGSNPVQADLAGIQNSIAAMNTAADSLNSVQNQITSAVAASDAFWVTAGARRFRDAMVEDFRQSFASMVADLQAIEHALNKGHQQYNATIDQEASHANAFLNILNH